jgi:hypothetical protein
VEQEEEEEENDDDDDDDIFYRQYEQHVNHLNFKYGSSV